MSLFYRVILTFINRRKNSYSNQLISETPGLKSMISRKTLDIPLTQIKTPSSMKFIGDFNGET
jgi:hypothetical protein